MPSLKLCRNCQSFWPKDGCCHRHAPSGTVASWSKLTDPDAQWCDEFRHRGSHKGATVAPGEKGVEGEMLSPTPPYREGEPLKEFPHTPIACAREGDGQDFGQYYGRVPANRATYLGWCRRWQLGEDLVEAFWNHQQSERGLPTNPNHYWTNRGRNTVDDWAVFLRNLATDRLLQNKWRRFLGIPELPREENRPAVETVNRAEREILERTKDEW